MKVVPLAIGILAASLATASTILLITNRNEKLATIAELARTRHELTASEKARAELSELLSKERQQLKQLDLVLSETRQSLSAANRRIAELDTAILQSKSQLTLSQENVSLLNGEIAGLRREQEALLRRLGEIAVLKSQLESREQELALLRNQTGPDGRPVQVSTPGDLRSVMAVGPDNSFVITNLGVKAGARKGSRLLIRRGTEFIGTALISDVLEDLSIAQIDPQSLREALRKGDGILLAQ